MRRMTETYREKLVYTESEDGYLLEGAQFTPDGGGRAKLPVVWIHGFSGRFYEQHTVAIGRRLAERGHLFVTGNNRGHHLGTNLVNLRSAGFGTPGSSMLAGAWWEEFEESPSDYAAWVGFAVAQGFPRVVLAGHSLGALKVIYYGGTRSDDRLAGIVSASGPVRLGQRMRESADRIATAEKMVAEGRGTELLPSDGTPMSTSAQTLVSRAKVGMDLYGIDTANAPVSRIRCPLLFILGSEEPGIGVRDDLAILRRNARSASRTDELYVEGANHIYTGCELAVADGVGDWVASLG
ncbi:MAG: alpha/beta fold hydrolase [Chloroflexota bacterium]|nr:MAG: alpha/beta fold hydrolase [Chloroflexota bacterium]